MHLPSSPEEEAGAVSLLLDAGSVSLLEEFTMFSDEPGVAEEAGVSELDDSTSAELELSFSSAELNTGATFEDELSGDSAELDKACSEELSVAGASVLELESSPQATRNAVKSAHKKTSERNLIQNNIKKIPDQVGDDILRLISVDLTSLGALRAQDLAGIKCEPTSGLPLDTLTSLLQVLLARG